MLEGEGVVGIGRVAGCAEFALGLTFDGAGECDFARLQRHLEVRFRSDEVKK